MNVTIPSPRAIIDPCNVAPDAQLDAIISVIVGAACFTLGINYYRHMRQSTTSKCLEFLFGTTWMVAGFVLIVMASVFAPELNTAPLQPVAILINFAMTSPEVVKCSDATNTARSEQARVAFFTLSTSALLNPRW